MNRATVATISAAVAILGLGMLTECTTHALHVAHVTGNYRTLPDAFLRMPGIIAADVHAAINPEPPQTLDGCGTDTECEDEDLRRQARESGDVEAFWAGYRAGGDE